MPYSVSEDAAGCAGYAVVKDGTGEVMGCHTTESEAQAQLTALNIAEFGERFMTRALPDNYRPAVSADVPEGRACGNCAYYNEDMIAPDGVRVWCELWDDYVRGDHYCNRWAPVETDQRDVDYTLPDYIANAAARGLELRAEGFGGDGLTDGTIREARAMADGIISDGKVIRANAWGARHEVDLDAPQNSDPDADGWPGAGAVAHYLWGIDPLNPQPARNWFARVAEAIQEDEAEEEDDEDDDERSTAMQRSAPTVNLVRAASLERAADVDAEGRTLTGYFSVFDEWYEVNSAYEGRFMERISRGAFTETLARNADRIKVLYDHGADPSLGNKPLGRIRSMGEDKRGAYYEVELIDTDYNRDFIVPAARAGLLGSSFRFQVVSDDWREPRRATAANPARLPERTITAVDVFEFGPVTFPANPAVGAVAVRSGTDEWFDRLLHDPQFVARFTARVGLSNVERALEQAPSVIADATCATVRDVDGPPDGRSDTPAPQPTDGRSTRTKNQRLAAVAKVTTLPPRKDTP